MNSDESSADTRTAVLSREKKGRVSLVDKVNVTGLLRGAATKHVTAEEQDFFAASTGGMWRERGD